MTVYTFHFKDPGFDTYRLYAFTNKKKYAEEFKKQRDMKKFYCKTVKMSEDEYITELLGKRGALLLHEGHFYTRSQDNPLEKEIVTVLCTVHEENSIVKGTEELWMAYMDILFDVKILEDEYIQALTNLLFTDFYYFYKIKYHNISESWYAPYYSSYGPAEDFILGNFREKFSYDELNLFLKLYQNTFEGNDDVDDN